MGPRGGDRGGETKRGKWRQGAGKRLNGMRDAVAAAAVAGTLRAFPSGAPQSRPSFASLQAWPGRREPAPRRPSVRPASPGLAPLRAPAPPAIPPGAAADTPLRVCVVVRAKRLVAQGGGGAGRGCWRAGGLEVGAAPRSAWNFE